MTEPTMPSESHRPSKRSRGDSPPADARQRLLAAVVFLAVLVVGGLGGIALDRWVLRPADELPADGALLQPRVAWERELVRELRLTRAQEQQLDSLLIGAQERARAVSREAGPQFRAILRETLTGLNAILTPQQRERLREIRRERQSQRRDRLEELRQRGFNIPDDTADLE